LVLEEAILPGLRQASVVEVSLDAVIPENKSSRALWAFLKILNDWVEGLGGGDLHFGSGTSSDLDQSLHNIKVRALWLES